MPVGEKLVDRVAATLHISSGQTIAEIGAQLSPPVTPRAVRYAVARLIAAGRAKRHGSKYQHHKITAVVVLNEASLLALAKEVYQPSGGPDEAAE
jgi:hypothetical protein